MGIPRFYGDEIARDIRKAMELPECEGGGNILKISGQPVSTTVYPRTSVSSSQSGDLVIQSNVQATYEGENGFYTNMGGITIAPSIRGNAPRSVVLRDTPYRAIEVTLATDEMGWVMPTETFAAIAQAINELGANWLTAEIEGGEGDEVFPQTTLHGYWSLGAEATEAPVGSLLYNADGEIWLVYDDEPLSFSKLLPSYTTIDPETGLPAEEASPNGRLAVTPKGAWIVEDGAWVPFPLYDESFKKRKINNFGVNAVDDEDPAKTRKGMLAQAASAIVNPTGTDNAILFTAKTPGAAGNNISVQYVHPGYPSSNFAIDFLNYPNAPTVKVQLATDSMGNIITTAAKIVSAIIDPMDPDYVPVVSALITATCIGNGSGIVTGTYPVYLKGGADEGFEDVPGKEGDLVAFPIKDGSEWRVKMFRQGEWAHLGGMLEFEGLNKIIRGEPVAGSYPSARITDHNDPAVTCLFTSTIQATYEGENGFYTNEGIRIQKSSGYGHSRKFFIQEHPSRMVIIDLAIDGETLEVLPSETWGSVLAELIEVCDWLNVELVGGYGTDEVINPGSGLIAFFSLGSQGTECQTGDIVCDSLNQLWLCTGHYPARTFQPIIPITARYIEDPPVNFVASTLETNIPGDNNDLVFTSKLSGNYAVQYHAPSGPDQNLRVEFSRGDTSVVRVYMGSDWMGEPDPNKNLASAVKDLIESDPVISTYIGVAYADGNDGSGAIAAMTLTPLTGGTDVTEGPVFGIATDGTKGFIKVDENTWKSFNLDDLES